MLIHVHKSILEQFFEFWKKPLLKEKGSQEFLDEQKKPWTYLKMFRKKNKNFKVVWAVLGHSKLKILFGQPWKVFQHFGPGIFLLPATPRTPITVIRKQKNFEVFKNSKH